MIRHLLARAGFRGALRTVHGPAAALRFMFEAIETAAIPQLILVDLTLPEMHGLDLVREIRRLLRGERAFIAVVTSSDHGEDIDGAFSVGADAYIEKYPLVDELIQLRDIMVGGVRPVRPVRLLRRNPSLASAKIGKFDEAESTGGR